MRMGFVVVLSCLATVVSIDAQARRSKKPDLVVDLKFTPQEGVSKSSVSLPMSIIGAPVNIIVEDARQGAEPKRIGEGTDDDDLQFLVLTTADVGLFVKDTIGKLATEQGLKVDAGAGRRLGVKLTRFSVSESNKAVGSTYAAEVHLAFDLKVGTAVTEGAVSGQSSRYGRARSIANCNEVLSDALKDAFVKLLGNDKLQSAWGK